MNQLEKRNRELSKAIMALSNGIKAKEVKKEKKKTLDFLNLPKPQPKPVEKKTLDFLQKKTGLPIPKKLPVKHEKELTFLGNLTGINHEQLSQQAIINKLTQNTQAQIEEIKAEFVAKLEEITLQARVAELVRQNQPKEDVEVTDELVLEILKRIKKLPNDKKLEVTDIRNYQSFIFKGHRSEIEELMHGGGSGHGLDIEVNGIDKGTLEILNFVAGDNVTLTYSTPSGIPTITFSATGGVSTGALAVADISSQANGTNKTFTIPPNTSVLEIIGSDAPFIYRQGIDYTVSGTTITFTAAVPAPSAGATLLVEYTPGAITVAFYDLSTFTDGLTSVFAIPATQSILSLRGSDFPIIYEPNVDFTVVGNILNLFTPAAPSAGSTLILDYTTSTPTATTVDLTSQVNGTNMVFNIPVLTSAIALTGTDAPIVYRQGIDYLISGTILVLTGVKPPTGTLLLTYV